jgi:hypothetical protein
MTAVITGASSGMGRDIARELSRRGARLIISGRNTDALEELRDEIGKNRVKIIAADLSQRDECIRLYEESRQYDPDILVNNAGFGLFGHFAETDLDTELKMIDVNIKAVHTLAKLFLHDFREKDSGYILNVASAAGFMPGPYMATYYSTKNYVVRLTEAVCRELKNEGSNVSVSAFCPGPVNTNFNNTAGVKFSMKGLSSEYAAWYAVNGMFAKKQLIIPTVLMKLSCYGASAIPPQILSIITGKIQSQKGDV